MTLLIPYGYGTWETKLTVEQLRTKWTYARLAPEFRRRLEALFAYCARHGHPVGLGGGARSYQQQLESYKRNPANFAPPGSSYHEDNTYQGVWAAAADLIGDLVFMNKVASKFGLNHFGPTSANGRTDEPWHVQPIEWPNAKREWINRGRPPMQVWNLPIIDAEAPPVVAPAPSPTPTVPTANPATGSITVNLPFDNLSVKLGGGFNQFVANVQALLNGRAGREVVEVDGYFGPKTEAIVKLVQAEEGVTVDGIVGPITLAAIWNGRGRG